jgi:hypothetical protein
MSPELENPCHLLIKRYIFPSLVKTKWPFTFSPGNSIHKINSVISLNLLMSTVASSKIHGNLRLYLIHWYCHLAIVIYLKLKVSEIYIADLGQYSEVANC